MLIGFTNAYIKFNKSVYFHFILLFYALGISIFFNQAKIWIITWKPKFPQPNISSMKTFVS